MVSEKEINVEYISMNCIRDITDYYICGHDRWANAMNCYVNGDYLAAVYLGGYSAECLLKYVILDSQYSSRKNLDLYKDCPTKSMK